MPSTILTFSDIHIGGSIPQAMEEVGRVLPTSPESTKARDRTLDFLRTHPDALHRSCSAGHLTGSALIVDNSDSKVLVMLHKKLNIWLQPGGHADGEGYLSNVARREAYEETGIRGLRVLTPGIDCDIHRIPKFKKEEQHFHYDTTYLLLAPETAKIKRNHESLDMRWVTLEELEELTQEERLRRLARIGISLAREIRAEKDSESL
ncbi:MAG: NUDIX domain-containing protein [Acidimicrobiales bacterium]|nr:NUDIX domain-containing protein [Acidimicrobiales bacterium]